MADRDLPVWTIKPNWSEPIVERLEWLTDVMISRIVTEQRAGVRLTPRRQFEFKVNPTNRERSYLELWLHRMGAEECLLPLWHDVGRLSAGVTVGSTRIPLDTTYREFEEGGLAILIADTWTWEVVGITTLDDTGLDIDAPTILGWSKGATIHPLRVALMDEAEVTSSALTSRVGESKIGFTLNRANPFTAGAEVLPTYDGLPVVTLPPNRMDALETRYQRVMEELDNGTGRRRRYDENARAFSTQFYNWQAKGRQQHAELRAALYRLSGRRKPIWLPTFNDDFRLSVDLGSTATNLRIDKIGYRYLGSTSAIPGKADVMIRDDSGNPQFKRITGTLTNPSATEERLTISGTAGFTASAGRNGSFMSTVRMDQDLVEITHHTDSDGLCECSAAFKAFNNTRSITGPLILPTPSLTIDPGATPCGTPGDFGDCGPYIFDGIYARLLVTITEPGGTDWSLYNAHTSTDLTYPPHYANPGGYFAGAQSNSYPNEIYETNSPDPLDYLAGQLLWRHTRTSATTFVMECHYPIYDKIPPGSTFHYRLVMGLAGTPQYTMTWEMFNGYSITQTGCVYDAPPWTI